MAPKRLKFIKAYYPSTNEEGWSKWGGRRFDPAFDEDAFSTLPSSSTLSTGFLAKLGKITQGFRLQPSSMCLISPMLTTS